MVECLSNFMFNFSVQESQDRFPWGFADIYECPPWQDDLRDNEIIFQQDRELRRYSKMLPLYHWRLDNQVSWTQGPQKDYFKSPENIDSKQAEYH